MAAPLWCDLGFVPNSNKAAANRRPNNDLVIIGNNDVITDVT